MASFFVGELGVEPGFELPSEFLSEIRTGIGPLVFRLFFAALFVGVLQSTGAGSTTGTTIGNPVHPIDSVGVRAGVSASGPPVILIPPPPPNGRFRDLNRFCARKCAPRDLGRAPGRTADTPAVPVSPL